MFGQKNDVRTRAACPYAMAALYMFTGLMHLLRPATFLRIMPPWAPMHQDIVFWSGIAEMLLGIGLLFAQTRRIAAWTIIVLLVIVFPANVQMAINWFREVHPFYPIALLRLPLQFVLIAWAYRYARKQAI